MSSRLHKGIRKLVPPTKLRSVRTTKKKAKKKQEKIEKASVLVAINTFTLRFIDRISHSKEKRQTERQEKEM
jgi:hypothetical protein